MEIVRWLLTAVLAAGFFGLAAFNWRAFWVHGIRARDEPAAVPVAAGLLGIMAVVACPVPGTNAWWWVPLLIDFGSLPYGVWLAYMTAVRHP